MLLVLVPDAGAVVEILRAVGVFEGAQGQEKLVRILGLELEQLLVLGYRLGARHVKVVGEFKVVEQVKRALVAGIVADKLIRNRSLRGHRL